MKTIIEYPLSEFETKIQIYTDYQILSIGLRRDIITLWALVDTNNEMEIIKIKTYTTGDMIKEKGIYLGIVTYSRYNVLHFFQIY